ncbi:MAG: hypothetical protein PF518_08365 [Spirochaetaceae bacterium]|jgi:hypothetical protein|nr:hypothetical protein [Spirochaetaceae bacterium]
MVLLKEFRKSIDDDYENMSVLTGSLRQVLKALKNGQIPHKSYSEEELIFLCKSLIYNQDPNGSWPVHRPEDTVAEEDLVDFIFFPTQIACSILAFVKQKVNFPELPEIDEALSRGLKFSVSKNLEGFGHNNIFQKLESLIIFIEGSVPELLNNDPRICPACYHRIIELREEFQNLVDSGNTTLEFGGDYKEQFEFVLQGLSNI